MGLISRQIDSVVVHELPAGIDRRGRGVSAARTALVRWRSRLGGLFHQVYVNGRFAGATVDTEQRQMVVPLPGSFEAAVGVEVFAVEPGEADTDFGGELRGMAGGGGRVRIVMLRDQSLPAGAMADVYWDAGTGQIDYGSPVSAAPIRIWAAPQDKAGFGTGGFGLSDFGYDSAAAVGLGKGSFGHGMFGLDADTLEWVSGPLEAGVYRFAVKLTDPAGRQGPASESGPVTVTPPARPAEGLCIESFEKQSNELVLGIV